ncbi:hypothetical protein Acid345_0432 [Candidatus Koribacter versatilis Ellin345]|uniref:SH3b domain-containing protein n=1 Tax=Koribacter versatilis (strain Ellin345) TaxID=204669 RepID=Q1IUL3_KORVE|nr:hypothetical protein [Candidatus Koribacter versatilis]ABF39437.1 hypothetical protein Acid345_0432 [Candidatus Koribacter versatilis Ellin345]
MKRALAQFALLFVLCAISFAQETEALRQTFHAPKGDIEQALKDLSAYQPGRLPFVEGFVGSIDAPLKGFQRPSYQYAINLQQASESEVTVSVNAKISAWYEDKDATKSGYRELPSNGRLETDLFDRLRARLSQHAADIAASRTPLVSPKLMGTAPMVVDAGPSVTPAPTLSSAPPSFRAYAAPAGPLVPPEQNPRYQRLVQEEKSLNEVIAAQQHPSDLVAVKAPHTPIVATPTDAARVVMYADAEDEFQYLKTEGEWTHVQISGLNRGWIRSAQVEQIGTKAAQTAASTAGEEFRLTKEETSTFPGDWAPLRGKNVKIIWVQPNGKSTQKARLSYAESVFKKQANATGVDGVVVVFDAAEGGMAAATTPMLRQWIAGTLTDPSFLAQCWFDPADAFARPASSSSK